MVDIKTLGQSPDAPILSIAAVPFQLNGVLSENRFFKAIYLESNYEFGRKPSESTIEWWMHQNQSTEIQSIDQPDTESLPMALSCFEKWMTKTNKPDSTVIWANGASFDFGILRHAFEATSIDLPWGHWQEHDVRTIASLIPEIKKAEPNRGSASDPIENCIRQIKYLVKTISKIDIKPEMA